MGEIIKVAIAGINGKMGRASCKALLQDSTFMLVTAFGKSDGSYIGSDVGRLIGEPDTGAIVSANISEALVKTTPDVLLDFTHAEVAVANAKLALEHGVRPVIGTSGISPQAIDELSQLAGKQRLGAMVVPNFSVGAVLMMEFAKQAGQFFSNVEIVEMHHTKKLDAPSGTAMHTANKLASLGAKFNPKEVEDKELLPGARGGRSAAGVHIHSLRLPGLISHQEVIFGAAGELLTVRHDSFNTDCFIKGIVLSLKAVMNMNSLTVGLESLLLNP